MNDPMYDVLIIGGGVIGAAVAYELAKYQLKTVLVEAKVDLAAAATKGNGGVTHSGYDVAPGTMKARVNCRGTLAVPRLAKELGFKFNACGTMTVAVSDEELPKLKELHARGLNNGVPGCRIIGKEEIFAIEPHLNPDIKYALRCPTAGVVDPYEMCYAYAENAYENGVEFRLNCPVTQIEKTPDGSFAVTAGGGVIRTRFIANCAGTHGDDIAHMLGIYDFTIKPRYGEMILMDKAALGFVPQSVCFPLPGNQTKGIAVIPLVEGNALIGSTARVIDDKDCFSVTASGITELEKAAQRLYPMINRSMFIREVAGHRPVWIEANDFYIQPSDTVKGFVSAVGIQSPGIGASPAIAELVRDLLEDEGLDLKRNRNHNPYRAPDVDFSDMTDDERKELIAKDKAFGRVICRCETVTEGEIVAAVRRPLGAHTVDGVKRRTRAGMGRCQGGFCQPRVLEILSKELNKAPQDIMKENHGSPIVYGALKGRQ